MTDRPVIFSVFEGQMGLDWTLWEELMGGLHICSMLPQGRGVAKGEHVWISGVLVSIS